MVAAACDTADALQQWLFSRDGMLLGQGVASGSAAYQGFYYTAGMLRDGDATLLVRKNALTPHHTTHTLPMARASAGARGLTTEDGARSTQTSSSAGSKGVWL